MSAQTDFADALLDPARPAPAGLSGPGGRPAGKRFDVYRNNVVVSLTEALGVAFPVVRKLLGASNFRILARAFLQRHPPRSPRLMLWGDALPDFVDVFAPTRRLGYLPDVARLEQAIRESYHEADTAPFDAHSLSGVPPEALLASRLVLAPTVRVIESNWPVLAIWRFNSEEGAPKPVMEAQDVMVTRPGFDPIAHLLPPGAAAFLAALGDGDCLGEALGAPGVPESFDLQTTLGLLFASGALTSGDLP